MTSKRAAGFTKSGTRSTLLCTCRALDGIDEAAKKSFLVAGQRQTKFLPKLAVTFASQIARSFAWLNAARRRLPQKL